MTSSPHALYIQGYTRYNGRYNGSRHGDGKAIPKRSQFDCRLQLACMKSELPVTAGQHTRIRPGLCTTARHTLESVAPEVLAEPARDGGAEGGPVRGEVVTR